MLDHLQQRFSISRRGKATRLPRTPEERGSPLHVASVAPMRVDLLRQRMKPEVKDRFDQVWQLTLAPGEAASAKATPVRQSDLCAEHARMLEEHGIACSVSEGGPLENIPFTVLEEKESGLRQRFILWTKQANDLVEERGYVAQVPLFHVSAYLQAINEECGSTRDFRTGFYAVEIPEEARRLFRFQDDTGNWWELTRLPMGHACAPELMHTLAATAAGHPDFAVTEFCTQEVLVDVWVDNIRYAGAKDNVLRATARLDQTAVDCAITWKDADSRTAAQDYEFIGVRWNHHRHQVAVGRKLEANLLEARHRLGGAVQAHELETLGGRLLHASAVSGVFPGSYYFTLKFLRRVINALNRGVKSSASLVPVPGAVRTSLESWISAVLSPRKIPTGSASPSVTAFVDASLKGWGGVLVNGATMELTILGSSWSPEESMLHINELEALAFWHVISALSVPGICVHVVVDNTTVKGVARKGACLKSAVLNNAVVNALEHLRKLQCFVSVRWVESRGNPADIPSRVPLLDLSRGDLQDMRLAVRRFLTRGVAGG